MSGIRGPKKKYPEGVTIRRYPIDSRLSLKVGEFGTANDTLSDALEKALAKAAAGNSAGLKPRIRTERETIAFNVREDLVDEVVDMAEQITGQRFKFEKSLQIIIDLAEQAKAAGSA